MFRVTKLKLGCSISEKLQVAYGWSTALGVDIKEG